MKSKEMVKMLPDAYKKTGDSNNYKMFKLFDDQMDEISLTQEKIREYHSIDLSQGKTLDLFGENLGLSRNGLTDDVYRVLLKAKALRNQGTGSFNNTTELIAYALNTDVSNIKINEDFETGGRSGYITINNLPLTILNNIGMSIEEYEAMLKDIIPIGLGISVTNLEGTFSFAFGDGSVAEIDEDTGFANDEQTIGGTLGATVGNTISYELIEIPLDGTLTITKVLRNDEVVESTEGVSIMGKYILIDREKEINKIYFTIENSSGETFNYVATKGILNYWNYVQVLSISEPENTGELVIKNPNTYIVVNGRDIEIQNDASMYDKEQGVIFLTSFAFYETANNITTNYIATLGEDNAWRYETI